MPMRPSTSGSSMTKTGCMSATSGRNMTSSSHSSAPTDRPWNGTVCLLRIIMSELRATESSGFNRPPSRTGRLPNASRSRPRTLPGGVSDTSAPSRASAPALHGTYLPTFMSGLQRGNGLTPPHATAQREREVDDEPDRDEHARDVRDQPARVLHHLQHRQRVTLAEAGLVERLPVVAERLVHVDEDVALLVP